VGYSPQWRIYFLLIIIVLIGGTIIARLFSLQILRYDFYHALAQDQHQFYEKLFPQRGEIFIQDLKSQQEVPLAINKEFEHVYAVPRLIPEEEREELAKQLASLLDLNKEVILNRISKTDDPYEPLKHKVDKEVAQQIKDLGVDGIRLSPETWRYYPAGSLASHLVGFVGLSDEKKIGQYGLEGCYEDELKGQLGFLVGEKDIAGYWIPTVSQKLQPAQDGSKLILTIDQNIQFRAEKELEQMVKRWSAEGGTIIVMEPSSGAIRAMANWPNFDPNQYSQVENINVFLNPSIQKIYEPGSVFKPITMAAALDTGQISPESLYYDDGLVKIGGYTIRNVDGKKYGWQTMTQVLEKSLNTGAVFVQKQLGNQAFREYVQAFGFDRTTGIDLAGEISGNISNLFIDREINFATASFGQGIAVTPLELIVALGAIANQGKLMRPFVVEKIIRADGTEQIIQPQVINQVVSPKTAIQLTRMLVSVVENGYGRPAQVKGYDIAGKTGTAQVPDPEKGGYSDKTIHTFVGFGPAFDPKFIILVKLDNPQGIRFAADSVSPVFKRLAEYLFNYFEIPPQ
jgi:cell division protein FtsI/penicillin-binding protein 2